MFLPLNGVGLSAATSTSSRQFTLTAKVSSPFGARPREQGADAAGLAEEMVEFLLAELIVRQRIGALDELELRRLDESPQAPRLMQIEQLQSTTCVRSLLAS